MSPLKILCAVIFAGFGAYSTWAMLQVGYLGIWQAGFAGPGALQVLLDLCILGLLASLWIIRDARAAGRNPWIYVILTVTAGSFGPLLYLLLAPGPATAPAAQRGMA